MEAQDVHHAIYHPLSRLILDQYCDNDGVSKNGSRRFLFETGIVRSRLNFNMLVSQGRIRLDFREVPIMLNMRFDDNLFQDEIFNWRNCDFPFSQSCVPIDEEERIVMGQMAYFKDVNPKRLEEIFKYPSALIESKVSTCCGYCIGYWREDTGGNNNILSESPLNLSNLPHLRQFDYQFKFDMMAMNTFSCLSNLVHLRVISYQLIDYGFLNEAFVFFSKLRRLDLNLSSNITFDIGFRFSCSIHHENNGRKILIVVDCLSHMTRLSFLHLHSISFRGIFLFC